MKQIYGIIVAISLCLLAGCTNEGGNENYSNTLAAVSTKQLLDIVSNPNSKSSDLILEFPTLYVDSISGNDVTNTGTQSAPFRSITKAILVAKAKTYQSSRLRQALTTLRLEKHFRSSFQKKSIYTETSTEKV